MDGFFLVFEMNFVNIECDDNIYNNNDRFKSFYWFLISVCLCFFLELSLFVICMVWWNELGYKCEEIEIELELECFYL